ncbi:MAG TPA: tetratricopeptide repeat protein [Longimicrobium sp.]
MIRIAIIVAVAVVPAVAAAQPEPARPALSRGADPNDWEAYFDEGTRHFERFPTRSAEAFYWAARLDPTRAEPLFAQWATFYARDWGLWLGYVDEEERVLRRPEVLANQELRERAYYRNPFVHRGFEAALWSRLGRQLRWDGAARAFLDYGRAEFPQAAAGFGRVVRANPVRNARFRYWRALAFVGGRQYDSAGVELSLLLETLRTEDEVRMREYYDSKALLEYALGMLHEVRGRPAEARAAWERALVEDLAMYPARAALGRLSLRERRVEEAVEHLALAVEIAPGDPVMHYEHGNALMAARRRDEAIAAYQRATELEPYWAAPYLPLGVALDHAGQPERAAAALRAYLERAPRSATQEIQRVTERLAALGQAR